MGLSVLKSMAFQAINQHNIILPINQPPVAGHGKSTYWY